MYSKTLKVILVYCTLISLLGNFILAFFHSPPILTFVAISLRDLIIFAVFFMYAIIANKQKSSIWIWAPYLFTILLIPIVLYHAIFIENNEVSSIFRHLRVIIALPIIVLFLNSIIINQQQTDILRKHVNKIIFLFLALCCVESLFLITNNHPEFISSINFYAYMQNKGTQASIGYGLLEYRLITPAFNPSIGGIFLAAIAAFYLQNKKYMVGAITLFLLLLTASKSGYILFLVLLLPYRLSIKVSLGTTLIFLTLTFFDISYIRNSITNEALSLNIASALHHLDGLRSGMNQFFSPLGIGSAGTVINNLDYTSIGRESAIGLAFASIGIAYIIPFSSAWQVLKKKNSLQATIVSAYIMLAAINEAAGSFYIWITIYLIIYTILSSNRKNLNDY